jgi:hypothetical protein
MWEGSWAYTEAVAAAAAASLACRENWRGMSCGARRLNPHPCEEVGVEAPRGCAADVDGGGGGVAATASTGGTAAPVSRSLSWRMMSMAGSAHCREAGWGLVSCREDFRTTAMDPVSSPVVSSTAAVEEKGSVGQLFLGAVGHMPCPRTPVSRNINPLQRPPTVWCEVVAGMATHVCLLLHPSSRGHQLPRSRQTPLTLA